MNSESIFPIIMFSNLFKFIKLNCTNSPLHKGILIVVLSMNKILKFKLFFNQRFELNCFYFLPKTAVLQCSVTVSE